MTQRGPKRTIRIVEGRRGADIADRRERILDVAAELLAGAGELSMRTLAARAGVSVMTIYNLVGDQESVLLALIRRPAFRAPLRQPDAAPLDGLYREVEAFADAMVVDSAAILPAVRALMRLGFAALRTNISPVIEGYFQPRLLEAAALGGLRPSVPPDQLAERLAALGIQAILDWASGVGGHAEFRRRCLADFILVILAAVVESERDAWESRLTALIASQPTSGRNGAHRLGVGWRGASNGV
jgi:AcrR family transcriptional regulator